MGLICPCTYPVFADDLAVGRCETGVVARKSRDVKCPGHLDERHGFNFYLFLADRERLTR